MTSRGRSGVPRRERTAPPHSSRAGLWPASTPSTTNHQAELPAPAACRSLRSEHRQAADAPPCHASTAAPPPTSRLMDSPRPTTKQESPRQRPVVPFGQPPTGRSRSTVPPHEPQHPPHRGPAKDHPRGFFCVRHYP